jgi:hypothetical protein
MPLAPGTSLNRYEIKSLLGRGAMGEVYRAHDRRIGGDVAVKILPEAFGSDPERLRRFDQEARAAGSLNHPNIVAIFDVGVHDSASFVVSELLEGDTLRARLKDGAIPLRKVLEFGAQIARGLAAAHAKGIVHRDLKPDNIFVTPTGRPKVLDFGIAKLAPELGGSYTQTGSLLGTPHYMAPEQAAGRPIDYRADLYAMGVILFECVTGAKPFHGNSLFDLLRKHVDEPPPRPSALRPDLPAAFEHVILTALAKAPDHRWQSAHAMSTVLQQATAQLPPEQWAPMNGGAASGSMRVPSGAGWTGMPASGSRTPPAAPIPGQAIGPGGHPGPHPTTVSGQVGAAAARKSHGGVWIALAVLVAGGGIAAAIVAGHGAGGTPTAVTTTSSPPPLTTTPPSSPPSVPPGHPAPPVPIATTDPGAPAAGSWIKYRALSQPGWDAKHVDVDAFIAWATVTAKQAIADAQMFRIDAMNVYPDGHADLTLSSSGFLSVRFLSPSRSKRDPSVPVGAQPDWHCMFQVIATVQTGPIIVPMDGTSCEDERALPVPHCNTRGVWQQMIAKHAPGGNAVAQLGYWSSGKGEPPLWYGSVTGAFSQRFPDACP